MSARQKIDCWFTKQILRLTTNAVNAVNRLKITSKIKAKIMQSFPVAAFGQISVKFIPGGHSGASSDKQGVGFGSSTRV